MLLFVSIIKFGAPTTATISSDSTTMTPITITSNSEFTSHGFTGSGTKQAPYVLSNVYINGGTNMVNLLDISDTNAYFIVKNSNFWGGKININLYNVSNGLFLNNTFQGAAQEGVCSLSTNKVNLTENTFQGQYYGLLADGSNSTYTNNRFVESQFGFDLEGGMHNMVENNMFRSIGYTAIGLNSAENNSIVNNSIDLASNTGIRVQYSSNNTITQNLIRNSNTGMAILGQSGDNQVALNSVYYNDHGGLLLDSSSFNTIITNNTFSNNYVSDNGTSNQFTYNYWRDHSNVDANHDSIADSPYLVPGTTGTTDPSPLANPIYAIDKLNGSNFLTPFVQTNERITISWTAPFSYLTQALDDFNISLYMTTGQSWKFLGTNLQTSYDLSNSSFIDGNYSFRLVVVNILTVKNATTVLNNYELAHHHLQDLEFLQSYKGETLTGKVLVKWKAPADNFNHTDFKYDVYLSADNGSTYSKLGDGLTTSQFHLDTTKYKNGTQYKLKIQAYDVDWYNAAIANITTSFSIMNAVIPTTTISSTTGGETSKQASSKNALGSTSIFFLPLLSLSVLVIIRKYQQSHRI